MSPEERRKGAFEEFEELLMERVPVDEAVNRAAEDNGLRPEVFKTVAEQQFGPLSEYACKLELRAVREAIVAEVRHAASKRHPANAFADCYDFDEVAANVEAKFGRSLTDTELTMIAHAYRDSLREELMRLQDGLDKNA